MILCPEEYEHQRIYGKTADQLQQELALIRQQMEALQPAEGLQAWAELDRLQAQLWAGCRVLALMGRKCKLTAQEKQRQRLCLAMRQPKALRLEVKGLPGGSQKHSIFWTQAGLARVDGRQLSPEASEQLRERLLQLYIPYWAHSYQKPGKGGIQWSVKLEFFGGFTGFRCGGCGAYPENFQTFLRLFT